MTNHQKIIVYQIQKEEGRYLTLIMMIILYKKVDKSKNRLITIILISKKINCIWIPLTS